MRWHAGQPGGGFAATATDYDLPTLPWRGPGFDDTTLQACTLSGQISYFANTGYGIACVHHGSQLSYHFQDFNGDGLVDVATNVWHTEYFPTIATYLAEPCSGSGVASGCPGGSHPDSAGACVCDEGFHTSTSPDGLHIFCCPPGTNATNDGDCALRPGGGGGGGGDGGGGDPPDPPPEDEPCLDRALGDRRPEHDGVAFLWRIYLNTGTELGSVASCDGRRNFVKVESEVALPPNAPESIHSFHEPWGMIPTLVDLDGDQLPDILDVTGGAVDADDAPLHQLDAIDWRFWRGHNHHPFGEAPDDVNTWFIPRADGVHPGFSVFNGIRSGWIDDPDDTDPAVKVRHVFVDLVDVNGDGRPDLLAQSMAGELVAYLNEGGRFRDEGMPLGVLTSVERTTTRFALCPPVAGDCGDRRHDLRLLDVDGDHLVDQVAPSGAVRLNAGALFLGAAPADVLAAERRLTIVDEDAPDTVDYTWHLENDWIDVTGDGLADQVRWDAAGARVRAQDTSLGPPRLLRRIDNGRGRSVDFEYAPSTDPRVVTWSEGARLPQARW
ncbi:MAG: toxin TcdB middle/N-terminal domain-containing protein, partial [Candidatus Rokuibacteriota bacterium]